MIYFVCRLTHCGKFVSGMAVISSAGDAKPTVRQDEDASGQCFPLAMDFAMPRVAGKVPLRRPGRTSP